MDRHQLSSIDLNLLVALDILLTERNVTRAAARLGLSQSAMSHALRRLRTIFNDQLLIASPRGMVPTERALELVAPIQRALASIESILYDQSRFDPATAQRKFTIIATDYIEYLLVPRLLSYLSQHAPGIDLLFRTPRGNLPLLLEEEADLVVGVFDNELESSYRQELFREEFVCVVRADHPQVREALSLEQFAALPHVLFMPRELKDTGLVDNVLAKLGKTRRIALSVPYMLVAPVAVASSDLILTSGARLASAFAEILPLRLLRPPLNLPTFPISQYWHERRHREPAHVWFRGVLAQLFPKASPGPSSP